MKRRLMVVLALGILVVSLAGGVSVSHAHGLNNYLDYSMIDYPGDTDIWYMDAYAGQYVVIGMVRSGNDLDPYLRLYAPTGELIAVDDDGGSSLNAEISGYLPQSGRYIIQTSGYGNSTGEYQIAWRFQ
jgi:hypothetical protein